MFNNKNTQCVKYLYSQVMSLYCIKLITVPVYIAFDCYRTITLVLEQKNTTMTYHIRILMQAKLSAYEYLTIVRLISIKMLPHCYQNWRQNWVDKNAEKIIYGIYFSSRRNIKSQQMYDFSFDF